MISQTIPVYNGLTFYLGQFIEWPVKVRSHLEAGDIIAKRLFVYFWKNIYAQHGPVHNNTDFFKTDMSC